MKNTIFSFIIFSIIIFSYKNAQAQDSIPKNTLFLKFENLNFVKNNEYFNTIADGYTLIGTQLHPKLAFYPDSKLKLEIGVFGLTYAGLERYHKVIPTFAISYLTKKGTFTMGTLDSYDRHQLISPLSSVEQTLSESRIENGLQYRFKSSRLFVDTWLNWESFIFKRDTHGEAFTMGISAEYKLIDRPKWKVNIPLQNTLYHRGGQINTNELNERWVFTMRHTALGIQLKHKMNEKQRLSGASFFLQHQSTGTPAEMLFKNGFAWFSNLNYSYNNLTIGVGHWYGDRFVSPHGNDMFQSVSSKTDIYYVDNVLQEVYTGYADPIRSLLLSNLSYKKELIPYLDLYFHVNGYYQNYYSNPIPENTTYLVKDHFDYAVGLQLIYKGQFKLNQ